jgi:hypothetical protein
LFVDYFPVSLSKWRQVSHLSKFPNSSQHRYEQHSELPLLHLLLQQLLLEEAGLLQ